jgi:hypothetical protein
MADLAKSKSSAAGGVLSKVSAAEKIMRPDLRLVFLENRKLNHRILFQPDHLRTMVSLWSRQPTSITLLDLRFRFTSMNTLIKVPVNWTFCYGIPICARLKHGIADRDSLLLEALITNSKLVFEIQPLHELDLFSKNENHMILAILSHISCELVARKGSHIVK